MPKFTRSERLRSQTLIQSLFTQGRSFYVSPFKVVWMATETVDSPPAQILISIPKKTFKHAVTRNLLRRRIREIYRKNKSDFYQQLVQMNRNCLFALIYTGREVMASSVLEPKIIITLQRLIQENVKTVG
ncbi:MAG: ribonuclease P protein component [Bacteroidales bacterium]|nr:ribonuclease P protein component [Bacteroidales bacterium]